MSALGQKRRLPQRVCVYAGETDHDVRFIPARCNITKMSPTLLRIAGMPNYWSNIKLRNDLPVLENYLFPEIFSNLFDENVMQNAAAANNRKEYPRRSAVSSCV